MWRALERSKVRRAKDFKILTKIQWWINSQSLKMAKSLMHWLKSDVKLVSIQEVDELYRSNPFILTGYRDKTTFFGCLKSVLLLHNETINIWSHLLGFAFFVGIFLRDILFLIPSKESGVEVTQTDFFVLCTLIICYQVKFLFCI